MWSRHIARAKKNIFFGSQCGIHIFETKKCRILTLCNKTVLMHAKDVRPALTGSRPLVRSLALSLSLSLWLYLDLSGSLCLSWFAHLLLRYNTLSYSVQHCTKSYHILPLCTTAEHHMTAEKLNNAEPYPRVTPSHTWVARGRRSKRGAEGAAEQAANKPHLRPHGGGISPHLGWLESAIFPPLLKRF